jgi:predicted short-subunit dehydrogenase-like oxidoreductase (DUF2520 family)
VTPRTLLFGTGRLAVALAGGLRLAGAPVVGLWGRRAEAAREAAARAGVPALTEAELGDAARAAEVLFFAVSDRAIPAAAAELSTRGVVGAEHVALHGSGAQSAAEALAPLAGLVRGRGTLHLLRAIPDGAAAMGELAGTYMGVEGDEAGRGAAEALARALGGRPFELGADAMPAYHAAAAFASNFAVALLDAAVELAREAGISPEVAVPALAALARGSLEEAAARGPEGGLTGPIRRGDRETVLRHLDAIGDATALRDLYRALGRRAAAIARRADPGLRVALDEIDELLA